MTGATNQNAYGNPGWGTAAGYGPQAGGPQPGNPWGRPWERNNSGPGWGPPPWHAPWLPRPLGIVAMVLGFIVFWPVGLAILFYLWGTGRMGCKRWRRDNGYQATGWNSNAGWGAWKSWMSSGENRQPPSSGNRAFDEYRAETLRRLEEEQNEFGSFLDRLRFARDKSEFDQFMAERRNRPTQPAAPEGEPAPG